MKNQLQESLQGAEGGDEHRETVPYVKKTVTMDRPDPSVLDLEEDTLPLLPIFGEDAELPDATPEEIAPEAIYSDSAPSHSAPSYSAPSYSAPSYSAPEHPVTPETPQVLERPAYIRRSRSEQLRSTVQLFAIGLILGLIFGGWEALSQRSALSASASVSASSATHAARLPSPNPPAQPVGEASSTTAAPFRTLFGPEAMSRCIDRCEAAALPGRPVCMRSCARLSYTHFGRRILLNESSVQEEADRIVLSCKAGASGVAGQSPTQQWRSAAAQGVDALRTAQLRVGRGSAAALGDEYAALLAASASLARAGAGSNSSFSGLLQDALCLRAHLSSTELALQVVQATSDSFSERFYSELHRLLGPTVLEREAQVLQDAKRLELPYEKR